MKIKCFMYVLLLAMSNPAWSGTCPGPAPTCDPAPAPNPIVPPPDDLCLGGELGCLHVIYMRNDDPVVAGAWYADAYAAVDGYSVRGTAGPCLPGQSCPAIFGEAKDAVSLSALHAFRVMRYLQSQ